MVGTENILGSNEGGGAYKIGRVARQIFPLSVVRRGRGLPQGGGGGGGEEQPEEEEEDGSSVRHPGEAPECAKSTWPSGMKSLSDLKKKDAQLHQTQV